VAQFNFCVKKLILHSFVVMVDQFQEGSQMWLEMWLPLLSMSLIAAIFFGVASFVMGREKPRTGPF
jgi:hypothetical protein